MPTSYWPEDHVTQKAGGLHVTETIPPRSKPQPCRNLNAQLPACKQSADSVSVDERTLRVTIGRRRSALEGVWVATVRRGVVSTVCMLTASLSKDTIRTVQANDARDEPSLARTCARICVSQGTLLLVSCTLKRGIPCQVAHSKCLCVLVHYLCFYTPLVRNVGAPHVRARGTKLCPVLSKG